MAVPNGAASWKRVLYAVAVLVAFWLLDHVQEGMVLIPAIESLYAQDRGAAANVIWKGTQAVLTLAAVMALRRSGPIRAAEELGLARSPWRGMGVALAATAPAALGYLVTGGLRAELDPAYLAMTAVASPLSEEILFRGFVVGQLWLRARWPFWAAVVVSAIPFGLAHLYQADALAAGAAGAIGVVTFTGLGSALFAWLWVRWDGDLWVPIGYHALANLWFYVFDAGPSPLASAPAFVCTVLAAVGMIVVTLWWSGGWRVERRKVGISSTS